MIKLTDENSLQITWLTILHFITQSIQQQFQLCSLIGDFDFVANSSDSIHHEQGKDHFRPDDRRRVHRANAKRS